jgi:hypothetical protein
MMEQLSSEGDKGRKVSEEWSSKVTESDFDLDAVGNRKYRNLEPHIEPLVESFNPYLGHHTISTAYLR